MRNNNILELISTVQNKYDDIFKGILTTDDYQTLFSRKNDETLSDTLMQAYGIAKLMTQKPDFFVDRYDVDLDFDLCSEPNVRASLNQKQTVLNDIRYDFVVECQEREDLDPFNKPSISCMIESFIKARYMATYHVEDDELEQAVLSPEVLREFALLFSVLRNITVFCRVYETKTVETLKDIGLLEKTILSRLPKTIELKYDYDYDRHNPIEFKNLFQFYKTKRFTKEDLEYIKQYNLDIVFSCYIEDFKLNRRATFKYNEERDCFFLFYKDSRGIENLGESREQKEFKTVEDINHIMEEMERYKFYDLELN